MALFPIFAQRGKDLILVVDTSSSMFSYYNELGTYLSGPFLAEHLASGDTIHIISFGSKPRFEIARQIVEQGDVETASARIWLLYPLSPASDPAAALSYAEQYVRTVPGGRPKKIFIVSGDDLSTQVNAAAGRLDPGVEIFFIRASSRMGTGTSAGTTVPAASTGTTAGPAVSGTVTPRPGISAGSVAPGTVTPAGPSTPAVPDGVLKSPDFPLEGTNPITETLDQPDSPPFEIPPEQNGNGDPGEENVSPNQGITPGENSPGVGYAFFNNLPLPLLLGIGAILLFLILLIIILRIRKLHSSPNKVMAEVRAEARAEARAEDNTAARNAELLNSFASQQAGAALRGPHRRNQYRDPGQFLTTPPMLNLFVEEQNTAIGRRNVHSLKRGSSYSVGGGNSDFLIFLVPIPPRVGRLYFDGTNCTFTPLRPEFFPDLGSTSVPECIGKTIRIISKKNYEIFFHFERYKDPLIAMNQLLHSIQVPEAPGSKRNPGM